MRNRDARIHAIEVLAAADPELQLAEACRRFMESPTQPAASRSKEDLNSWCLERMKALCGETSLESALHHRDILTLAAFGYLLFLNWGSRPLPRIRSSMPVPAALQKLEPDFFPTLLKEIRLNARQSPSFGKNIKSAEGTLPEIAARVDRSSSIKLDSNPSAAGAIISFLLMAAVIIAGEKKKDGNSKN